VLARTSRGGRDRLADTEFLRRLTDEPTIGQAGARHIERFGLNGVEIRGQESHGRFFVRQVFAAGDGSVTVEVNDVAGIPNDDLTRRFLDSVEISTPWSIRAFPQAGLALALPSHGIEFGAKELHQDQALLAKAVLVGGTAHRAFSILVFSIAGHPEGLTFEQRLQLLPYLLNDLGREGRRTPVDFDGLHGVETWTLVAQDYRRTRILATAHQIIALTAVARTQDLLNDKETLRFFESLRWYDATQ
jgi:hypothetical protein